MFDHRPNRCPHNTLDVKTVDHFRTEYYCVSCGEQVGWSEDIDQDEQLYVTGKPRRLTTKEKEDLR